MNPNEMMTHPHPSATVSVSSSSLSSIPSWDNLTPSASASSASAGSLHPPIPTTPTTTKNHHHHALNNNNAFSLSRNRGNYRCSKCGEPKKGHVCPFQKINTECPRCGNQKKECVCEIPATTDTAVQCERDSEMTVRLLDLSAQGITDFDEMLMNIVATTSFPSSNKTN